MIGLRIRSQFWFFILASLLCSSPGRAQDSDLSERKLCLDRMSHWRQLAEQDQALFSHTYNLRRNFIETWATLDLNEALQLNTQDRFRMILLHGLAVEQRWDEVVELAGEYPADWSTLPVKFWSDVANLAAHQNDMQLLELSGVQVEALGQYDEPAVGGLPRPNSALAAARFIVAAARLELLRRNGANSREVSLCSNDLIRAAGAIPARRGSLAPQTSEFALTYALLESWGTRATVQTSTLNQDAELDELRPYIDKKISWPRSVDLPPLDHRVTTAWVLRQAHQQRADVVLSYLMLAQGDKTDRARLFAASARRLNDKHIKTAQLFLATAKKLGGATVAKSARWKYVEALAEIARSSHHLGESDSAAEWLRRAIKEFELLEPTDLEDAYHCQIAIIGTASQLQFAHTTLPSKLLEHIDRYDAENAVFTRRRINETINLTKLSTRSKTPPHPSHLRYFALVESKDWPAALAEAQKLAEGNSAWKRHFTRIGGNSFLSEGLQKTMCWARNVEDQAVRMAVEIGAIQTMLESSRRTFEPRDAKSLTSVAPSVVWPSGC